jgi:hypothetical protein
MDIPVDIAMHIDEQLKFRKSATRLVEEIHTNSSGEHNGSYRILSKG